MYTLRSVTDNDFDFIKKVELGGLRPYITEVFGWDDEFQDQRFIDHWRTAGKSIICVAGEDVGVLEVREQEGVVFLARLFIRADRRNRGIGSEIINDVVAQAHAQQKTVALKVLLPNPACRLYERLGFVVTDQTTEHYVMTNTPSLYSAHR